MKAKLTRTNAKAEGFRVVDLPRYDVTIDGQKVGEVRAYLTRETRHYTSGSVKRWAFSAGRERGTGFTSKAQALQYLLEVA